MIVVHTDGIKLQVHILQIYKFVKFTLFFVGDNSDHKRNKRSKSLIWILLQTQSIFPSLKAFVLSDRLECRLGQRTWRRKDRLSFLKTKSHAGQVVYFRLFGNNELSDITSDGEEWQTWKNLQITQSERKIHRWFSFANYRGRWGNLKRGCDFYEAFSGECVLGNGIRLSI